ncbi:methylated-DNA-protein-cysteine methyltransferase-like protein [Planomicrobium stackebrandtii]|uniref:Methylated-DNA-protein-cysteine methyltransferase-like protein n=1 Tax=Planomicrobium stackebrandtii TaxID=253160 RepID=A0ABU0GUI0_9BACL|nr:MGMT family protein [Planomicrobium stackebrandtii]MDQ0429000.1 methylated-DNA-protein-cysteine methyltransferase-like protein [Planomicrobium stackebrandtii]
MQTFTEKALDVMKRIPSGKIMTYGQVAAAAGSPRAARQVTRILHSMSAKYNLPWHRVVNAQGQIVLRDEESRLFQKTSLQREGVEVDVDGQIDLSRFRFDPGTDEENGN